MPRPRTPWASLLLAAVAVASGVACRGSRVDRLVSTTYPPHERKVCVLAGALPSAVPHLEIANLSVELNSYGGDRKAKLGLAKQARKLGADAVVKASFTNTMGAPNGTGVAVVYEGEVRDPPAECEWY